VIPSRALRQGAREALGVPAAVLGAGFLGYGSMAADAGYPLVLTLVATFAIWALPGQLVLMEMQAAGAALAATVLAVSLSAARFLPMTLTLMPLMRRGNRRRLWPFLLVAQLVSMTTWAVAVRRFDDSDLADAEARWQYFLGFSAVCIGSAAVCAAIGQLLIGALPPLARFGLALLTPLYFFVTLVGEARTRSSAMALACGAVVALALHEVAPGWSLPGAGLIGGSAAFWMQRRHVRRA
jgi:predicted branched-subunit amino acid permease